MNVPADSIEPLIHRGMIARTEPINRDPPQATGIRQAKPVTGDPQINAFSARGLGKITVNQRLQAGNRQLPALAIRNDAREVEDRSSPSLTRRGVVVRTDESYHVTKSVSRS
ncbi:hypothetical protein [Schaalia odontolytica]|uniref:hypothetical protein n=1 Tax=Schaalia odontolytica TaxID=1660 RepID=UPI00211C48D5|nr:hypothetical protein [Schaalia odontolytica]UUO93174.1 hypothetical protein NQK35_08370 [Schaalia odontolytica]